MSDYFDYEFKKAAARRESYGSFIKYYKTKNGKTKESKVKDTSYSLDMLADVVRFGEKINKKEYDSI